LCVAFTLFIFFIPIIFNKIIKSFINLSNQISVLWKKITLKKVKEEEIQLLIKNNKHATAEALLRKLLRRKWHEKWIYLYGLTNANDKKQLSFMEKFYKDYPIDSPISYLTLGRLAFRNKLWGKARNYLEHSLSIQPSAEAYAELGKLLDTLGDKERSDKCFKAGLDIAINNF